jgi:t-SNARE complex subunit (syntaxin)
MQAQINSRNMSSADSKIQNNQISNSLERLKKLIEYFYKIQSEYRDKSKERFKRQLEISKRAVLYSNFFSQLN